MTHTEKRHTTIQARPPAEPEQKTDCTSNNPLEGGQPNSGLPEMAPVALHNDMKSGQIPAHVLGTETHVSVEPDQEMDPKADNPLEGVNVSFSLKATPSLFLSSPIVVASL